MLPIFTSHGLSIALWCCAHRNPRRRSATRRRYQKAVHADEEKERRWTIKKTVRLKAALRKAPGGHTLRVVHGQPQARGSGAKGLRKFKRGASIILTQSESSSGPHADDEDTLLLNVSGARRVWFASPAHVSAPTNPCLRALHVALTPSSFPDHVPIGRVTQVFVGRSTNTCSRWRRCWLRSRPGSIVPGLPKSWPLFA